MGVALLDSSAVVGFLDADDALHGAADEVVRRVAGEHALAVSAVTIAEVLTGAELGRRDETMIRRFLTEIVTLRCPVGDRVAERAAELRAADRVLRMPDALILATADLHADVVVTGDARWRAVRDLSCAVAVLEA